jgi:hypothetical protein
VLVEHCNLVGGQSGVFVGGGGNTVAPGMNIFYDDIHVDYVNWTSNHIFTSYQQGAGIQIGGTAYGGSAYITNSYSYGGGDVNLEIQNAYFGLFQNDVAENAYNANFEADNNAYPLHLTDYVHQTIIFDHTISRDTASNVVLGGYFIWDAPNLLGVGDVIFKSAIAYASGPHFNAGKAFDIYTPNHGTRSVSILDGSKVEVPNLQGGASASNLYGFVNMQFGNITTQVTIRDFSQWVRGAKGAGAMAVVMQIFDGPMHLTMDNVVDDVSITGISASAISGIGLGYYATATISGIINNYRPIIGVDTYPYVLTIFGKTYLTIPSNGLTISNCDFTHLLGGVPINFEGTGGANYQYVKIFNNAGYNP